MRRSSFRAYWLGVVLVAAVGFFVSILTADDKEPKKMLFKLVEQDKEELDSKQTRILKQIKDAKGTLGTVHVLTAGFELSDKTQETLYLPLPGQEKALEIKDYKFKLDDATGAKVLAWKSKDRSGVLTLTGDCWEGSIYAHDKVYNIQPLSKGLHAISQTDQTKLIDDPRAKP